MAEKFRLFNYLLILINLFNPYISDQEKQVHMQDFRSELQVTY